MDNTIILQQFEEIEEKVEKLINTNKALEATNSELKNKIASLEKALQDKVEAEKSYAEEKGLIRSKVDGLLARLEEISEA